MSKRDPKDIEAQKRAEAADAKRGPGYDGKRQIGFKMVADPLETSAQKKARLDAAAKAVDSIAIATRRGRRGRGAAPAAKVASTDDGKVGAAVNERESEIDQMFVRHQISQVQYRAALHWRSLREKSGNGRGMAIDPTRIQVDCAAPGEALTARRADAITELNRLAALLGSRGFRLVDLVCGLGLKVRQAARVMHYRDDNDRERRFVGRRLRECLDDIATFKGWQGQG